MDANLPPNYTDLTVYLKPTLHVLQNPTKKHKKIIDESIKGIKNGNIPKTILGYNIYSIILALSDRYHTNRFAEIYAKHISKVMLTHENILDKYRIIEWYKTKTGYKCTIPSYFKMLEYAPSDITLNKDRISHNMVHITSNHVSRLHVGIIRTQIVKTIRNIKRNDIPYNIQQTYSNILPHARRRLPKNNTLPPCVTYLQHQLQNGVNLSHEHRVFLAIYHTSYGTNKDDILNMFKNAPDYSETTTLKHLNFIKNKQYKCHNCKTIQTNMPDICKPDRNCERIYNPLFYRRNKNDRY